MDIRGNEIDKAVTIVDISNQPEIPEEQEDQVQLVRTREDRNSILGIPRITHDERIMSPQVSRLGFDLRIDTYNFWLGR